MRKIVLLLVCTFSLCAFAADPTYLPQNWSDDDRQWFYTTPQGSKLVPYTWALALEIPEDETRWVTTLTRYGFIENGVTAADGATVNPDALPVGLVRDGSHLGITCAACHTAQLEYGGNAYRIDGGPSDADLFAFLASLGSSVKETVRGGVDSAKFRRFSQAVLTTGDTPRARLALHDKLAKYNAYMTRFLRESTPTVAAWGPARTDAFGMIFNRVTSHDLAIPANTRSPNAPVSYPFLWDTSWHNKVQWNGVTPNSFAVERLARNVGEVLGVFAEIDIQKPTLVPLKFWYPSTANRLNMLDLEDRLSDLRSPPWPAQFPPLDPVKVSRGQEVYRSAKCVSCHAIATPGQHQNVTLVPLKAVNTDPAMTVVSEQRTALTGRLRGAKAYILFGNRLKTQTAAGALVLNAAIGAILSPVDLQDNKAARFLGDEDPDMHDADRDRLRAELLAAPQSRGEDDALRDELETSLKAIAAKHADDDAVAGNVFYKARPLDGIWATAPFLHNGSVPTLRDLLTPPAQRPATFYVGSREFDPVNVGQNTSQTPGAFLLQTTIDGNRNTGHEWGTQLSDEDRWALIEYLKSL